MRWVLVLMQRWVCVCKDTADLLQAILATRPLDEGAVH
jgi:hypothetical protein